MTFFLLLLLIWQYINASKRKINHRWFVAWRSWFTSVLITCPSDPLAYLQQCHSIRCYGRTIPRPPCRWKTIATNIHTRCDCHSPANKADSIQVNINSSSYFLCVCLVFCFHILLLLVLVYGGKWNEFFCFKISWAITSPFYFSNNFQC